MQLLQEVVLAVMLQCFKFRLSDKEIVWNLAGINYPTVGSKSTFAELPLKLEPILPNPFA